jgi:hypothetical protein
MSGHMSYFLWGPGKYDDSDRGRCDEAGLGRVFSTVQRATVSNRYTMPDENDLSVLICRNSASSARAALEADQSRLLIAS